MSEFQSFEPPTVTDDDISWACELLRLPRDAFSGPNSTDPRLAILKSNETLDVEACPGSGKTTLLVAKLAILARKWTGTRQGICVLSHTNVARREIEERLGATVQSSRLLAYPHFVGTIHGFVNEFLAMPWLRSKGFAVTMVDDRIATLRRWKSLPFATRLGLEKNGHQEGLLKITATDFTVGNVRWGKNKTLGTSTPTYLDIQTACRTACQDGFFCYDEMFLWAHELMSQAPEICAALRQRFPVVFIDEVQDNSELQSLLLFRLFTQGERPVIRQRFGDSNQAIYQNVGSTEGATTDTFPQAQVRRDIPNSHRFGQDIGDLANPLATEPQGLIGLGPSRRLVTTSVAGASTIFLFDDSTISNVLSNYAEYLVATFSELDLQAGLFTAVGAVHRLSQDDKLPRAVGHYCADYDHELTAVEARPSTFWQYVAAGRRASSISGETYPLVEKVAEAVLRLAALSGAVAERGFRKRKHRHVQRLLVASPDASSSYQRFVTAMTIDERESAIGQVREQWSQTVRDIATAMSGSTIISEDAKAFLGTDKSDDEAETTAVPQARENMFVYPLHQPKVRVRMGSIHSVKGETHTATLVLDTLYFQHHLLTLKPWLAGLKSGAGNESRRNVLRLRQHYVAMTRPSHLLCLAMREDGVKASEIQQLKSHGWRIARVTSKAPMWL